MVVKLNHHYCNFVVLKAGNTAGGMVLRHGRSRVANNHATKDGYTGAVGWSCDCTGLALLVIAAQLLLVLLDSAGLAAARRE
eukprot:862622-Pelagomonas_calceolata.AAC.1